MILHVLQYCNIDADYMVGAQLEGFDVMVRLTDKAPYMIMEGDEYPSSPEDLRPKFHLYKPHIALISGIAWDHINIFKTFDDYTDQFRKFIHCIEKPGKLIFCSDDRYLHDLCNREADSAIALYSYSIPEHEIINGITYLVNQGNKYPLHVFGKHNLLNIEAARTVCMQLGVDELQFLDAITCFKGASNRMEVIFKDGHHVFIRDFAHAPSKLYATVNAVRDQFPDKHLIACMELHTYSSLSKEFLSQYKRCMDAADDAVVFFSPHALTLKKLPKLDPEWVGAAFDKKDIRVITDTYILDQTIREKATDESVILLMSSGNFGGLNIRKLIEDIRQKPVVKGE